MIDSELNKIFDRRSAILIGGGSILTSVLIIKMLQMQVFDYKKYKKKSERNSFRIKITIPERGKILSESGSVISKDIPIYRIYIIPEEIDDLDKLLSFLAKKLNLSQKKLNKIYLIIKKQAKFQPVLISENSNWHKLAELQTLNISGLYIKNGFSRLYELGEAGSQVFGYVGTTKNQNKNIDFFTTGISGLEKIYNNKLAGNFGQTVMITNALGRVQGEDIEQFIEPKSGLDLKTTINENIQKKLFNLLDKNKAGCGTVLEIKTGNIIAMASAPSFDPNKFNSDNSENYIKSLRDHFAKPFINKTIEGLYPPGSTFKIIVALAALESGAISPYDKISCKGYWEYMDHRYHCWDHKGHGNLDLIGALKHSCDIYFYQIALKIGIDSIKNMALKLGLGNKLLNILPNEMIGILPDKKWKEKNIGIRWWHGDTIISGIGQGFVLSNCLQLAIMMARVISNKEVIPRIIVENDIPNFKKLNLQQKNINIILNGLEQVLENGGTAYSSRININGKKMAGKTGTSQVRSISKAEREKGVLTQEQIKWSMRNHGLFVGYVPSNNPKYVISVITEHSNTSTPAANISAEIAKELLKE